MKPKKGEDLLTIKAAIKDKRKIPINQILNIFSISTIG